MIINLSETNSLVGEWLSEIRDASIQTDRMRFRRNMARLGEVAAYEISKTLTYAYKEVQTPLGSANCHVIKEQPVIGTILRAGLALHEGLANYFDKADHAFISAYRKHNRDGSFDISLEYVSCPNLEGKVLILSDPMLATGASLVKTIEHIVEFGKPSHIHIVTAIACTVGIEYVQRNADTANMTLWAGDIDDELTAKGYIVPGLGDAGDLAFGSKMQQ
ncbi:uracil phosphoribosyltransferase [Chitinophaga skermanii]|uniref:Uracil phosphoribosyltransferase n=1 Tax=Chitinophaga skermanii TaxID=331697 RepID=A0A327R3T5_9BACT|nr:uracil phosphoribosyltransferase [Chitinophaga skermanii]RAJ10622.1 uracil phosphoribosyltransferase [Chitinophaga skermanii]